MQTLATWSELDSACKSWDADEAKFASIVAAFCDLSSSPQRNLADEFEVAVSTISRWASGQNTPHRVVQKAVVKFIGRRAGRALRAENTRTSKVIPASRAAKGRK